MSKKYTFTKLSSKLDGMIVVPTHKNCGDGLNEKQADTFQKELVKSWGYEEEDE